MLYRYMDIGYKQKNHDYSTIPENRYEWRAGRENYATVQIICTQRALNL